MDRVKEAASIIRDLNRFFSKEITEYDFIKKTCGYFDKIKNQELSSSDLKFLRYIANMSGVPHYYDLLFAKFNQTNTFEDYDLNTLSAILYESTLHVDKNIKIHKFQKQVLNKFQQGTKNRFFLSATTSFGKTFLIYEIIKKFKYKNVALIFPTIALLSENYEKLFTDDNYSYFYEAFKIHTLSDATDLSDRNIFIFTPERYLSFIDKHNDFELDFVFVDEIYKIDNEYLIDTINNENERDTAYRIMLQHILSRSRDILLVGPYIELPNVNNHELNQSFNTFLNSNHFKIIDFNKYEIVGKINALVKNVNKQIDEGLTLKLRGYSNKSKAEKVAKIVSDIRRINENVILYTRGPGTAETQVKSILKYAPIENEKPSDRLEDFISHLANAFKYQDWIVIKGLQHKIGIHHGLVPKYIQKEIINLFNEGIIDVLVSTTTITEGVNTSAKNLVVLNSSKGNKPLKTFDAKNIAGRAGRFLHHYSGRVLILDTKFQDIIDGSDNEIKHKNYDLDSFKDEIDYFITDEPYLSDADINLKREIVNQQQLRSIPDDVISMYRMISHSDKMTVYDNIKSLTATKQSQLNLLMKSITRYLSIDYDGFKVVLETIKPIVKNRDLLIFINKESIVKKGKNEGCSYPILVYMLSAYLKNGFLGSIEYNLKRTDDKENQLTIDEAVRQSSRFIFNTLKYQLVKYLGVFNMMYKYQQSIKLNKPLDEIYGIDRLLLKLEYNATSEKGRLASDYGVPSKIVDYYENDEDSHIRKSFDSYESDKFKKIEKILNR